MKRLFSSSTLVFLAIIGFLGWWIGGGLLRETPPPAVERVDPKVPTVAASLSEAETIVPRVSLYGNVVPNQTSVLRSRVGGIVESVVDQGTRVTEGEEIGALSADDREAGVARAQAQVNSADRDYEAARQLRERGVSSEAELQSRFAALEGARADLRAAELELANTRLRAPISGVVSRVMAETGTFVQAGAEILEIVDNDPLIAEVEVRQSEVTQITIGQLAQVEFQGRETREGRIRFIAPVATADTRTFRVELEIDNPGGEVPAGLSAQILVPLEPVEAHRMSPALVRLDDQGRIGVMVIDDAQETIHFQPIEIVQARSDAIWVTGPASPSRIVTISQGALNEGQRVRVMDTPEAYRGVLGSHETPQGGPEAAASLPTPAADAIEAAQALPAAATAAEPDTTSTPPARFTADGARAD